MVYILAFVDNTPDPLPQIPSEPSPDTEAEYCARLAKSFHSAVVACLQSSLLRLCFFNR